MKKSNRSNVDPFIVMDVMEAARKAEQSGKKIVHMEVGQPGTPAPKVANEYITKELKNNNLGYTVTLGLPQLRSRISKLYGEWYNIDLNPERVIITTGSSGGFILSFATLFDAGDRVGIGSPGYPSYRQILKAQNLVPVDIETELQKQMIANINKDYALMAIEPPYIPDNKENPKRTLITILGGILGGLLSVFWVLYTKLFKKSEIDF